MQAARLLEPRPRTVRSKLIEIARALQLEWHFSKREILGIWLTLAPYGGNLEGVRAGAMAWFGASARNLDAAQAALLVGIPRRPEALRPDRHPDAARAVRDRILAADGGDVPAVAASLPAPRATGGRAAGRAGARRDNARSAVAVRAWNGWRPTNCGDCRNALRWRCWWSMRARREIRAVVSGGERIERSPCRRAGSDACGPLAGIGDEAVHLCHGVRRRASPARKPRSRTCRGISAPTRPEDFDRGFAGGVTAGEALRRSLNLPAVALLEQIGPAQFAARLRLAGVTLRLPPGAAPSLPLALGGAGITLRDLTGLYAALATDGSAGSTRDCCRNGTELPTAPFLQPRAAEAIAAVLTQPFPDSGLPGIAWKTGTSWGGRDSWALGFDRTHVVGAWVGRPDGTPLPGATGRGLALPLLARVFEILPAAPRDPPIASRASAPASSVSSSNALRLLFPPPNAVVSGDGPVTLRAMGGRRPLTFLMNGAPLRTDPARREISWAAAGAWVLPFDSAGRRRRRGARQFAGEVAACARSAVHRRHTQHHSNAVFAARTGCIRHGGSHWRQRTGRADRTGQCDVVRVVRPIMLRRTARARRANRDYRLDFFRGLALLFIFIDHIPDNAISYFTLRSFALLRRRRGVHFHFRLHRRAGLRSGVRPRGRGDGDRAHLSARLAAICRPSLPVHDFQCRSRRTR